MTPNNPPTQSSETNLEHALFYAEHYGWHVFPLPPAGKECIGVGSKFKGKLRTASGKEPYSNATGDRGWHGFADGSNDPARIRQMWAKHSGLQGIGLAAGKSNLTIIDFDVKRNDAGEVIVNGRRSWKDLSERNEQPEPWSATTRTPSGGMHIIFKGATPKSTVGTLGPGIDTRSIGGYAVLPPTVGRNLKYYEEEPTWSYSKLKDLPGWVSDKLQKKTTPHTPGFTSQGDETPGGSQSLFPDQATVVSPAAAIAKENKIVQPTKFDFTRYSRTPLELKRISLEAATYWLYQLPDEYCDNYEQWLKVGFALQEFGEAGLALWIAWSKQNTRYEEGACRGRWKVPPDTPDEHKITSRSLTWWVAVSRGDNVSLWTGTTADGMKKIAPRPTDYEVAMGIAGWEFSLNEADYSVYWGGLVLDDILYSLIFTMLYEKGYKNRTVAQDRIVYMAFRNRFHLIKDYLNDQAWDGEDHIAKLATYFTDKNDVFGKWLRYWLIGSVARVFEDQKGGSQNRMLVLDGKQNLGKSYFVRWLASPVPDAGYEGPINTEDKDNNIRLMRSWIWEVSELGSTFKQADRDSLKAFISKYMVDVRKPYGHEPIRRPAISNFIGTLNNEGGFLNDPTGHRRFMVATLTNINWDYAKDVDIDQLWGQACALYKQGEPWEMTSEDYQLSENVSRGYEKTDVIEDYLEQIFEMDLEQTLWFTPTTSILERLSAMPMVKAGVTQRQLQMRVSEALTKRGLTSSRMTVDGKYRRGYIGIRDRVVAGQPEL